MKSVWVSAQADPRTGVGLLQAEIYARLTGSFALMPGRRRDSALKLGGPAAAVRSLRTAYQISYEVWPQVRRPVEAALAIKPPYPMRRISPQQVIVVLDLRWRRVRSSLAARYRWTNLARAGALADAIACISDATRTELLECFPHFAHKTVVAHPGPGRGEPSEAVAVDRTIDVLLLSGSPHKRIEFALEAIRSRATTWISSVTCVNPLPGERVLLDDLRRRGLDVREVVQPSDAQLWTEYRRARWVIAPGTEEGFGFVPFEALRAGSKVLLPDTPLTRELFDSVQGSVRVDPMEVGWAAHEPSAGPGEPVEARYSWDGMAEDLRALLEGRPELVRWGRPTA